MSLTQVLSTFLKAVHTVGSMDIHTDAPEKAGQVAAMKELVGLAGSVAAGNGKLTKKEVRRILKTAGVKLEIPSDEN